VKQFDQLLLFTPGPVNVPARVLAAGAQPMLHHRISEFRELLVGVVHQAQQLFATKQDVLLVHASGRGAMEGSIQNLFSPGDEIISVTNGKFGEMYADIATIHGLAVHRVSTDWLRPMQLSEVEAALQAYPAAKAVTVCHCETTSAVINHVQAVAELAHQYGKLVLVDAISSAGSLPIEFDDWGLDLLITASQKGLMCPTGVSLVVLSDAAWAACEQATLPKYYIQLREIRKNLRNQQETPGSTPVSLVASLHEALQMILEEGLESVYQRHELVANAIRAGVTAMGLQLFPPQAERRSPGLTAFSVPAGLTSSGIRAELKADYGIVAAEGLGSAYKETVVRIGHIGSVYPRDALTLIASLEATLHKLGFVQQPGSGVAACIKALQES
jgi:aspartate aminotransferase-like enzyme